jgi:hypothetical protein
MTYRKDVPAGSPFSTRRFFSGLIATGVVMWLFVNIQRISDMAPDFIANSKVPGALGVPIAILSLVWVTAIPIATVRPIIRSSTSGRGPSLPGPFALGAFLGLLVYFGLTWMFGTTKAT